MSIPTQLTTVRWIVINSSGGKDSQTALRQVVVAADAAGVPRDRLVVSHQCLGEMEWPGTLDLVKQQAAHYGLRLEISAYRDKHGAELSLLEQVERRGMWPSNKQRFCTSDSKRGPGQRVIVKLCQESPGDVLNVFGFRAEESPARAKKQVFARNARASNQSRTVWDWLPIFDWTEAQVWKDIKSSGVPYHPAYSLGMPRLSCVFCLAGETEVVTRNGLRSLGSMANTTQSLLIPNKTPYGLSGVGSFKEVEVRAFPPQRLWLVRLQRERQTKVVLATSDHRWLIATRREKRSATGRHLGYDPTTVEKTTRELLPGDVFRTVVAMQGVAKAGGLVPFAVAQGFVFGDGNKGCGDRPASLTIYNPKKDRALLPFFGNHVFRDRIANGGPALFTYGLPRLWKEAPDFRESRAFLLSWLAGYFAADGTVSKAGQARLSSARKENIVLVRSIAAVCGIRYGIASKVSRLGTGKIKTDLHSVTLRVDDLPPWFFIIKSHAKRVARWLVSPRGKEAPWRVMSVSETSRVEEVYCAVVPGSQAFTLSDGIMTGNCIFAPRNALLIAGQHNPELLARYVAVEQKINHTFRQKQSLAEIQAALSNGEQPGKVDGAWNM